MKYFLTSCVALVLALTARAADCPLIFYAMDAGWYNASNFHDPENNNYLVGYHAAGAAEFRDWFVFDLPPFSSAVASAELRLFTFTFDSAQGSETLELHHVATPVTTLTAGAGPGLTNAFNDLGDGLIYGSRAVALGEANNYITITLNSNALTAITTAGGQRFAIGGRVSSISPAPAGNESLFGYSSGVAPYVQLTLTFAGGNAPNIYAQPAATVLPSTGGSTNLSLAACGAAPLRYRWFFNNAPLSNQTNSTLLLTNLSAANNGDYFATVSNAFGVTTSSVTHLFAGATAPVILFGPNGATAAIGLPLYFNASVGFDNPPATLQWQFNGVNIPGATNSSVFIENVQWSHAGTYTFIASNVAGLASRSAVLTVEPLVIYGLGDLGIESGTDFYIEGYVSSSVPVTYQWRFQGTNIPGANAGVLSLFNVSTASAGDYEIIATNIYGARTGLAAHLILVDVPPSVSVDYYGSPALGSEVLLGADVTGTRPISLQWFYRGTPLANETNAQLFLPNLTTNDAGIYRLVASNAYGRATGEISFADLAGQPSVLTDVTQFGEGFLGEPVAFNAVVTGSPPIQFQWQFNGANFPGATNAFLLLTNVSPSDDGAYSISVSNNYGGVTYTVVDSLHLRARRGLDRWTWRNSRPQANDLEHLAFSNGRYVAAGEGGSLVTSTNAIDWVPVTLGNTYAITHVAAGNGVFAIIATEPNYSTPTLLTSSDGVHWTPRGLPFNYASGLDFANGQFLATGEFNGGSAIVTSSDGVTWESHPSQVAYGIAYGNGAYVFNFAYSVGVSPVALSPRTISLPGADLLRLHFLNGAFWVTGRGGQLWTSTDGRHWQLRNTGTLQDLTGIAHGNGRYVAVGDDGTLITSTDGVAWSAADSTTSKNLKDALFDGAQFVVCGNTGALLTSPNGVTWSDRHGGKTKDLYGIIYTNNQFTAVGYSGTILTSPDGTAWTSRNSGTSKDLHALTYAAGQYAAVGRDGVVVTSPNAINWTTRATPTTNYLQRLAWGNGRYVAVGENTTIISTTNGLDWQLHPVSLPDGTQLEGVAFGKGRFAVVGGYFSNGAHSVMLVSTNGTSWANVSYEVGVILRTVGFGNSSFIAAGNDGAVIYSSSGTVWLFPNSVSPYRNLRGIKYAAGRFVAVGNEGAVVSYNTYGWENHASISSQNLHDVAYGLGKFVAVGNAGAIVQSDDALPVFSAPSFSGGAMHFNLRGGLEAEYRVESSDNLTLWEDAAAFTNAGASVSFSLGTNGPRRFFRAVYP